MAEADFSFGLIWWVLRANGSPALRIAELERDWRNSTPLGIVVLMALVGSTGATSDSELALEDRFEELVEERRRRCCRCWAEKLEPELVSVIEMATSGCRPR